MGKSSNLYRDIFIALFLVGGVFSFVSGEFVISTLLFAMASLTSNLDYSSRLEA